MTNRPLFDDQRLALDLLRRSLSTGHRRPLLYAPTGFGKTRVSAEIINGALNKGKRVGFTVPRLTLVDQAVEDFAEEGINSVGVMQADHPLTDMTQPVQIISAATLARRKAPRVDLVLVDEAHMMHKAIQQWIDAFPGIAIGLSATPGSRGLGKHYDDLITPVTTRELIDKGRLSSFRAFAPDIPQLKGVKVTAGDFAQGQLGDVMSTKTLVGSIVETWLERASGRPTIAFCVNRRHAQFVCDSFNERGIAAEYMDAFTERCDRKLILRRLAAGVTKIICNVGVLTTGFDGDVRCVIDAHPTKSEMLWVQTIGRGLRTAPDKDHCLILDHAGNHIRHNGTVCDIVFDELNDGSDEARATALQKAQERLPAKPRVCGRCKALMPPTAALCPSCGHLVAEIKAKVVDGSLVEWRSKSKRVTPPSEAVKLQFYRELMGAKKPEWKFGWITAKFKEKFGHFAPHRWHVAGPVTPLPPSPETRLWLQSRQIAWAKSRLGLTQVA